MKNVNFESLKDSVAKSLTTATIIETVIIGAAIIAFIVVVSYLVKGKINKNDISWGGIAFDSVFSGLVVILIIVSTITITSLVPRPYAIANVEVTSTETVTKEFLQQNENFVEIDGKFYYKETLYQTIGELRKNIKSKEKIKETLEKNFNKIVDVENGEKWFKENTKTKEE